MRGKMKAAEFEKQVKNLFQLLWEFLPKKYYLYVPLVSAAFIWMGKRASHWKQKIFSWQVWPDPKFVRSKPDDFILAFFENNADLAVYLQAAVRKKDMAVLRKYFARFYPLLELQDPFLISLFGRELESKDFGKILQEFDARVTQAKQDIAALKDKSRFIQGLKTAARELVSLGADMLSQKEIQKMIQDEVKKKLKDREQPG